MHNHAAQGCQQLQKNANQVMTGILLKRLLCETIAVYENAFSILTIAIPRTCIESTANA